MEDLQPDAPVEAMIMREPDRSHSSATQFALDGVSARELHRELVACECQAGLLEGGENTSARREHEKGYFEVRDMDNQPAFIA